MVLKQYMDSSQPQCLRFVCTLGIPNCITKHNGVVIRQSIVNENVILTRVKSLIFKIKLLKLINKTSKRDFPEKVDRKKSFNLTFNLINDLTNYN